MFSGLFTPAPHTVTAVSVSVTGSIDQGVRRQYLGYGMVDGVGAQRQRQSARPVGVGNDLCGDGRGRLFGCTCSQVEADGGMQCGLTTRFTVREAETAGSLSNASIG